MNSRQLATGGMHKREVMGAQHKKRRAEAGHHPIGVAHAVAQAIDNAEREAEVVRENVGVVTIHVKDGKALTETGARLLGVRWPG